MGKFEFYLDQKATVWYRTHFEIDAKNEKAARQKAIKMVQNNETFDMPWELIDDTTELMRTQENDMQSTEELYYQTDTIWTNGD